MFLSSMKQIYKCSGEPLMTLMLVGQQCPGWFSVLKTVLCFLLDTSVKNVNVIISWDVLKLQVWISSKAMNKPFSPWCIFWCLEIHVATVTSCSAGWSGAIVVCEWKDSELCTFTLPLVLLRTLHESQYLSCRNALAAWLVSSVLSLPGLVTNVCKKSVL